MTTAPPHRSGRSPRPPVVSVDAEALLHAWTDLAKLKDPGFKWDGSLYGKPSRSLGSDQQSLLRHAAGLKPLLELCPSGFPSQASLRKVFFELEARHQVFGSGPTELNRIVEEACDLWRIMCRDVYNLKKNRTKALAPDMHELVNIIVLPAQPAMQEAIVLPAQPAMQEAIVLHEPAPTSTPPMGLAAAAALFDKFWDLDLDDELDVIEDRKATTKKEDIECEVLKCDSECEVLNIVCKCRACLPSQSSSLEQASMAVPSAKRGGQKEETKKKPSGACETVLKKPARTTTAGATDKETLEKHGTLFEKHGTIKIVKRNATAKRPAEHYLMVGSKYVVGQTAKKHKRYKAHIQAIRQGVENGSITTIAEAKQMLNEMSN